MVYGISDKLRSTDVINWPTSSFLKGIILELTSEYLVYFLSEVDDIEGQVQHCEHYGYNDLLHSVAANTLQAAAALVMAIRAASHAFRCMGSVE